MRKRLARRLRRAADRLDPKRPVRIEIGVEGARAIRTALLDLKRRGGGPLGLS